MITAIGLSIVSTFFFTAILCKFIDRTIDKKVTDLWNTLCETKSNDDDTETYNAYT